MDYGRVEQEIVTLINSIRKEPRCIVRELEGMLKCFKGKYFKVPGTNINIVTNEGKAAVEEAIEFLNKQKPLEEFEEATGLYLAAKDHANDIGDNGLASHEGSDKSRMCDRIDRYGEWKMSIAENIAFDDDKSVDIVIGMIIDDGNKSRGHRGNLFNPDFNYLGVACAKHSKYKHVTVLNFAVDFQDKKEFEFDKKEEEHQEYRRKTTIPDERKNQEIEEGDDGNISFKKHESVSDKRTKEEKNEFEMPENAVSCKVKKFIKTAGNKRTVRVIRTFKMKDGSEEVYEEVDEEYI